MTKLTYKELQFMQENDIQFDKFTTVSVNMYVPNSNDYKGALTKDLSIIIGGGVHEETGTFFIRNFKFEYLVY